MEAVGEGHDSEGSEWIVQVLEKKDDRAIVGFCLGWHRIRWRRPLWKIKHTKSADKCAKSMFKKLRVYTISDQDDSGPWIRKNFPEIFYVCNAGIHLCEGATWLGMSFRFPGFQYRSCFQ